MKCPIPHCKIPVDKVVMVGKLPSSSEASDMGCLNEFYFHNHEERILYKNLNPSPKR